MSEQTKATPGDLGIMAAALDDARARGLGEDDTNDAIMFAADVDHITAYNFLRNN